MHPWVGKIPWRRAWQLPPAFLPKEHHGQRSLAGCSPPGRKELDTTEQLSTQQSHCHQFILLKCEIQKFYKEDPDGTSLVVQWSRLHFQLKNKKSEIQCS